MRLKETVRVSVRSLVEYALRSGDLYQGVAGPPRSVEAIRVHRRIQRSRPPEYEAEVPVSHTVETEDLVLEIGGRIDGVYRYSDRAVIEEIKTVAGGLDGVRGTENPAHWAQVQVYAYMFARDKEYDRIDVQLVYASLDGEETWEDRRCFTRPALELIFRRLVDCYLKWAEAAVRWRRKRDASLQGLDFPYPVFRPGQDRMAEDVRQCLAEGGRLIVEAPTGIGKTMAALFPSVQALARGLAPKVFYLTARTTGREAAEKALDELRENGARLKSITLTAKEKVCFLPEAGCRADECRYARGYFDRLNEALLAVFRVQALTREAVIEAAETHVLCPFEFSLDLALDADVVIGDYNYAFDPRVYLKRFFLTEGGGFTFLVDEAHNLVERAREMFSARLTKKSIIELRRGLGEESPGLHRSLSRINQWMLDAWKSCRAAGGRTAETDGPDDLCPLLEDFLEKARRRLSLNRTDPLWESLLERYFETAAFLKTADEYDPGYTTTYETSGRDLTVSLRCLDPSERLKKALKRCRSAVFFSATMTPADYYRGMIGSNDTTTELCLPSPFPQENFKVVIAGGISTLYRHRLRTRRRVARAVASLVARKPGNYLVFFPSYQYLKMVGEALEDDLSGVDMIVQRPGMTEKEREVFLRHFDGDSGGALVGLAVMGGIFGEGIDLVGNRLTGAVVVGAGLPAISLERELIRDHFDRRDGHGYAYAYVYPGFTRVMQAVGRVIRSESDRGVALLIDPRFATPAYRDLMPGEWDPAVVGHENDMADILDEFWE